MSFSRPWHVPGLLVTAIMIGLASTLSAQQLAPNPKFTLGDATPSHWKLVGTGRWVDRETLEVRGTGDDSSFWRCDDVEFQPGQLYRFAARVRRQGGSGSAITGPMFANRDQSRLTDQWQWVGHVFRVPDESAGGFLRLGQWHATGAIQFDEVKLSRVLPVHTLQQGVSLGEGEMIRDGQYIFSANYAHEGSNYHRVLWHATADFNSDRWVFGPGRSVTYRFQVSERTLGMGEIGFHVNYHVRGGCAAEVSGDGRTWHELTVQDGVGSAEATIPVAGPFPTDEVYLRLRATGESSYFQVNRVEFRSELGGKLPDVAGLTSFAEIEQHTQQLDVIAMSFVRRTRSGNEVLRFTVNNRCEERFDLRVTSKDSAGRAGPPRSFDIPPRSQLEGPLALDVQIPPGPAGEREVRYCLEIGGEPAIATTLKLRVPEFYRSDYGERIAGVTGNAVVWWCDATRKVPRRRASPESETAAARLEAARDDREAVQIVVRPKQQLCQLRATASRLVGPGGATIPADTIKILRVHYHFVHHPTDHTGVRDDWPDALPPLTLPNDLEADENQPLWVLVHVPPDAAPGDYRGTVRLTADAFSAEVPLQLQVWDFKLPERNHLQTAYGLSVHDVFRYHQLKTDQDKRKVLDLYFQSFAEHRISPYDPTPLDPIHVKFLPDEDPPRGEVDFSRFDNAMENAVKKYRFTGFRLPIRGMGGGTFHRRYPPKIGEFGADTPEYRAMFSSYVQQLENHLRERGWLDMAYVYWFDEPAPRDYGFVANGMQRLKQDAPGLPRLLTEEPGDNELSGMVDIWCPVSSNYDHLQAERRIAIAELAGGHDVAGKRRPVFSSHVGTTDAG